MLHDSRTIEFAGRHKSAVRLRLLNGVLCKSKLNGARSFSLAPASRSALRNGTLESNVAGHLKSHFPSIRTFLAVGALAAGTLAATGLSGASAQSDEGGGGFGDQAEWAQSYDADARFAVKRSTTPVLSQPTFDATERAIDQYKQIVAKGGWQKVPSNRTLRLGSSGP